MAVDHLHVRVKYHQFTVLAFFAALPIPLFHYNTVLFSVELLPPLGVSTCLILDLWKRET